MGSLSTECIWLRKISLFVGLCACVCAHLAAGVRQELTLAALGTKGRFVAFASWKTISKMSQAEFTSSGLKWKKDASWDSLAMTSGPDPLAGNSAFGVTFRDPEEPDWWRCRGPALQLSTSSFLLVPRAPLSSIFLSYFLPLH